MNPLLAELCAEAWAMEPAHLERLLSQVAALPSGFYGGEGASSKKAELQVRDGVAHIPIHGTIMKTVPGIFRFFGIPATSTIETSDLIARAIEDERVKSIMLDVESPGGIVKGVEELAADLRAARDLKPVKAHITDLGASAAYWLASQAEHVSANAMATIGSIGVYSVAEDRSRLYESKGVKVHVISSHELKGAGVEGSPITTNQLADMQRLVDQYADRFVSAVVAGRGRSEDDVRKSATGQVWLADEARERGLIDVVQTAEAAHRATVDGTSSQAAVTQPAPLGASTEAFSMDQKQMAERIAQLEQENKGLAAQAASAVEALKANVVQRREDLIAQYRDRIPPTALEAVKQYGEFCGSDLAKFEAHLQMLTPVTRPSASSATPSTDEPTATLQDAESDVARDLGMTARQLQVFSRVKAYRNDGKLVLDDGRIVGRTDLLKEAGLV